MLLATHSFEFDIDRLELYWLPEGGVEPWQHWACGIYLVAEFAFVFVLFHIIKLDVS